MRLCWCCGRIIQTLATTTRKTTARWWRSSTNILKCEKYPFQTCQLQSSKPTGWWNGWAIHHKISYTKWQTIANLAIWEVKWCRIASSSEYVINSFPNGATGWNLNWHWQRQRSLLTKEQQLAAATEVESPSWNKASVRKYEQRATNSPSKQEIH